MSRPRVFFFECHYMGLSLTEINPPLPQISPLTVTLCFEQLQAFKIRHHCMENANQNMLDLEYNIHVY